MSPIGYRVYLLPIGYMERFPATEVRTIRDAAAAVRGRRHDLGLTQSELARGAGVSRKWVSEFEAGKASAQLGLLLRVFDELGLSLELTTRSADAARGESDPPGPVDLDGVLDDLRESRDGRDE